MTSDGTNSFVWNARNQLASMDAGIETFRYDPFGRRVAKTISGVTTNFLYDGINAVQELSGTTVTTVTANLLTGLGVDEYFTRTDSSGARSFLTDPLGSTTALADSTGSLQTQYAYEPFGNTTVSGAASASAYQYTGRENDGTGLYFYRARYYSPMFGRFVSQDPIGFAGGINLYAYVGNAPTNFLDPLGLGKRGADPSKPKQPTDQPEGPFQKVVHALTGQPQPPTNCTAIKAAAAAGYGPAVAAAVEDAAIALGRGEAKEEEVAAAAAAGTSKAEQSASEVAKALNPGMAIGDVAEALAGCH